MKPGKAINEAIQAEIDRRISGVSLEIEKGTVPPAEDISALDRLLKLQEILRPAAANKRYKLDLILLALLVLALAISVSYRLRNSPIELEVRSTRVAIKLSGHHSELLLPGELGEVLALRWAEVSGADQVDPPEDGESGTVILKQPPPARAPGGAEVSAPPVLLQKISIPAGSDYRIFLGVAYDAEFHGLGFETAGSQPAAALLLAPQSPEATSSGYYLKHAVTVTGKRLALRVFPTVERPMTIFRDTPISDIRFETKDASQSSILSGTVVLKEKTNGAFALRPGDHLDVQSAGPMSLRELSLNSGNLTARVSIPKASLVQVGDAYRKDLVPTLFDWVEYRWPVQLYGTLCAVAATWLAIRKWWTSR